MRLHTGERPYHCSDPNCDRAFATQGHLNDHFQKQHGSLGELLASSKVFDVCAKTAPPGL